jgi:glycosyltransferase involved in cell wall biosynthesis
MRLLVVSNRYPPAALGGYERDCAAAAARWRRGGHEVLVLTVRGEGPDVLDGVRVWRRLALLGELPRRGGRAVTLAWQARSALVARAALRAARPDVVVSFGTHGIAGAALARLYRRTSVAVTFDWSLLGTLAERWEAPAPGLGGLRLRGVRGAARLLGALPPPPRPSHFVFCSAALRRGYEESLGALPACVVHNGVPVPPEPPPLPAPAPALRVGAVGRLTAEKGFHTLVRAVRLLHTGCDAVDVEIRGPEADPAYAARLRELVAEAAAEGAAVRLGGPLEPGQVGAWMRGKDCIAFPAEWDEPFALVPLEAMAQARAVVGTATGGSGEVLADGDTALVHAPGDPEALAGALRRLADDRGLLERLALGGYRRVAADFRREDAEAALDAAVLGVVADA